MTHHQRPIPTLTLTLLTLLLLIVALPLPSRSLAPALFVAPPLAGPEDHHPQPIDRTALPQLHAQTDGLRAVAIVGDVGYHTASFKDDMDKAVAALHSHAFTVDRFYYGDRTFTWEDIVAAAQGAHMLLYMGHGIAWGGTSTQPTLVGGFFFSGGQYVHPDQIRTDLAGWMADDSVVILSHVCYSAGNTASDGPGEPSQAEAARRVRMYGAPFADIGMEAYFANNYYESSARIVHDLLSDQAVRKTAGQVFKSVYPYSASQFRDLTYPDAPGYDLWLSGESGFWNHAFVGIPDHVFTGEPDPAQLAPLPDALAFTYHRATGQISPQDHVLNPRNVAGDAALSWTATTVGDWFTVSPATGTSPDDRILISPRLSTIASLPAGHHAGQLTVTVTDPPETRDGLQSVALDLQVLVPRLAQLPEELTFTHLLPEGISLPSTHRITPTNIGSDETLTWQVTTSGEWLTVSPMTGQTPQSFTVEPSGMAISEPGTHTGLITVTVTAPACTQDAVQTIRAVLNATPGEPHHAYLPIVARRGLSPAGH